MLRTSNIIRFCAGWPRSIRQTRKLTRGVAILIVCSRGAIHTLHVQSVEGGAVVWRAFRYPRGSLRDHGETMLHRWGPTCFPGGAPGFFGGSAGVRGETAGRLGGAWTGRWDTASRLGETGKGRGRHAGPDGYAGGRVGPGLSQAGRRFRHVLCGVRHVFCRFRHAGHGFRTVLRSVRHV